MLGEAFYLTRTYWLVVHRKTWQTGDEPTLREIIERGPQDNEEGLYHLKL